MNEASTVQLADDGDEGGQFTQSDHALLPFRANRIDDDRLIWHPAVHELYDEVCSFFLLRFRNTRDAATEIYARLTKELDSCFIYSRYIFLLFGPFDVLIRIWALPNNIKEFRRRIRAMGHNDVLLAREIQVERCRILTSGPLEHAPAATLVQNLIPEINVVANAASPPDQSRHTGRQDDFSAPATLAALARLEELGLILRARSPKNGFRFITVLQPEPGEHANMDVDDICAWITEFNRGREFPEQTVRAAVYKGFGYADFLVTGIFASYTSLMDFSSFLVVKIKPTRIRTETYLNATIHSVEEDYILPSQVDLLPTDSRLMSFLAGAEDKQESVRKHFRELPGPLKERVRALFQNNEGELAHSQFEDPFRQFLLSRVSGDQRHLALALTSLLELEGLIVALWINAWKKRDLYSMLQRIAKDMELSNFDPNKPTLGALISVSRKLRSIGQDDLLSPVIGPEWLDVLSVGKVGDFRNDIAHGKLFTDSQYLQRHWDTISDHISAIGRLYNSVKRSTGQDGAVRLGSRHSEVNEGGSL